MTSSARSANWTLPSENEYDKSELGQPPMPCTLWMTEQRKRVPEGSATAKAIDYSLGPWQALTRYIDDGKLPADNNWVENQIRPIAIGRSNWLFAGSLRADKRAAAVMSLVHSARQWSRSLRISARCPGAIAHAPGQSHRRAATAPLAGTTRDHLTLSAVVKTGSPRAYERRSSPTASRDRLLFGDELRDTWAARCREATIPNWEAVIGYG
jgi:hypothetical protein